MILPTASRAEGHSFEDGVRSWRVRDNSSLRRFDFNHGGSLVSLVNTEVNHETVGLLAGFQPTTVSDPTVTPETADRPLCSKHDRPIFPSVLEYRKEATTGCPECHADWRQRTRAIREKRWRTGNIVCIKHPSRRAKRSLYVNAAKRKCGSCASRNAAGVLRSVRARAAARRLLALQEAKAI